MRKPRIHQPTSFYHVILRGNNGQDIFFSDKDRCRLCFIIQQGIERFDHRIHGFCFMNNHIHLIIQVGTISLSRIMHHLGSSYVRYINYTYNRFGHLFQGRFKAILVAANNYLSELIRYVHLNPVRAGIVAFPEDYLCSHEGRILGDDLFVKSVINKIESRKSTTMPLSHLLNLVLDIFQIPLLTIQSNAKQSKISQARGIIALLVREQPNLSIKELAILLGKNHSSLIRLASHTEQRAKENSELAQLLNTARARISSLEF